MFAQLKRTALLLTVASPLLVACSSNTSPGPDQLIYHNDAGPRISAGETFARKAEARGKSGVKANTKPGLNPSINNPIQGDSPENPGFNPRPNGSFSGAPITRSDAWSQFQGMGMMLLFASVLNGSIFERGEKIVDNTKSLLGSIGGEEKENSSESTPQAHEEALVLRATSKEGASLTRLPTDEDVRCLTEKAHQAAQMTGLEIIFEAAANNQK